MNLYNLMAGLAAGDALGATSEFQPLHEIASTYLKHKASGWPFTAVGGGAFGFKPGYPTDDAEMARAIIDAWLATAEETEFDTPHFDGEKIAHNFVDWMNGNPPDMGMATRATLSAVRDGEVWWKGGYAFWKSNRHAWSNGSLMRNGIVAATGATDFDVFRNTLHHGLITHWAPLPAICCAAQNWLIRNYREWLSGDSGAEILSPSWLVAFRRDWDFWLGSEEDSIVQHWRDTTLEDHPEAWQVFEAADFNPDTFRPFAHIEHIGFVLTTFQIGVWAMQWAERDCAYPIEFLPVGFPTEPFERTGAEVISWVAMIGRDSDTYGATAGPMVAAVKELRPELVDRLKAVEDLPREMPAPPPSRRN